MMDSLREVHKITLSEDNGPGWKFGWDIITYDDETVIEYWEVRDNKEERRDRFEITTGYDIDVFETAIKARKSLPKESD